MNAIELLKTDHQAVEALFQKAEEGKPSDALFNEIKAELEAHAYIEETIFYPAIQEAGDEAPPAPEVPDAPDAPEAPSPNAPQSSLLFSTPSGN